MDYKTNTHYPLSELENIGIWWQTHKQYDVNEYEDYCEIVERADHGAPSIIAECKSYLSETDYIIPKIQEAMILDPEEAENIKTEYAEILQKRKEARQKINELEELIEEMENGTKN